MKKAFLGAALLLMVGLTATAQPGPRGKEAKERMEAFKIAYFTDKLQLTPEESKVFWPLYNQFEKEQESLREKYDLKGKKLELMSDDEVEDFVMGQVQMAEDRAKIHRDYVERFKQILPIRKVAMLQQVNREFKRALLKEIRKRRQGGGRPGGNNR